MKITIIGTGYVGLVTGACFAEMGNFVTCVDIDERKIENLRRGVIPIYEPGLDEMVRENLQQGRLTFSSSIAESMVDTTIYFIAVGTPPNEDGSADLRHVLTVAREIGKNLNQYAVIVDKSTVPVGTADAVRNEIAIELSRRNVVLDFDVVSNPEFLKEGAAINDFMTPDRIIVGTESAKAKEAMAELYAPFNRNHPRTIFMGIRDAELTKYAANAMLATKISFMNEIANLADKMGVDVENVRLGIGSDQRIGFHFIYPGAGYGGSCFPKDVKALVKMASQVDFDAKLLQAVEIRNESQKTLLFKKISEHFCGDLKQKVIGVWGLAFKPGTDDMREAPSKVLIDALLDAGAIVRVYDPVAMAVARSEFSDTALKEGRLSFVGEQYETVAEADALVLVTEWKAFRNPDLLRLSALMKGDAIFDGRNQYDPSHIAGAGFHYYGIGRNKRK